MSEAVKVMLTDEQAQSIRDFVYQTVTDSVASVKVDAGISTRWLRKKAAARYAGVSAATFNNWMHDGVPCRVIEGVTLFDRNDIDFYINHNGTMN